MTDLTNILGGPWSPKERRVDPPEIQLAAAIRDNDLAEIDNIQIDGKIHRFGPNKTSWYIAYPDGIPAGAYGDWKQGISQRWRADMGRDLTTTETLAYKRHVQRAVEISEKQREKRAEVAGDVVTEIWNNATFAAPDHPYVRRKGIQPHGSRVTGDGRLVVPLYRNGELSSLQYISEDGSKTYHSGSSTKAAYWQIGSDDEGGPLYVAEGFATAASIHEATGQPCIVTYSASNIPLTVERLRAKDKSRDIVIVADNDSSGVGQNYADQASAKYGARVVVMPNEGEDANDYVQAGGDLVGLLQPKDEGWLIPADDFSNQPAPLKWLVKYWIQRGGLVMVHGPSGAGKSFAVLDMLMHVAAGLTEWHGFPVKPGPVVYLAGEGHHGLRGRIAAWKQHHGIDHLDMWVSKSGTDLNTLDGLASARAAIQALPMHPVGIAVDTVHRFLAGDENSAQDVKTMLDSCATLQQEFGATVILVHHTGVSDEVQHRARGSSAWKAGLDVEISVRPTSNDGPICIANAKAKDFDPPDPMHFDLESIPINGWLDEDGDPVTSAILAPGNAPKKGRPTKHQEWIRLLEQAWHRGERELKNDKPYVSRSLLREVLIDSGMSPSSVQKSLQSSQDRMIGQLSEAGVIDDFEGHGWSIIDQILSSIWLVKRD